MNNLTTTYNWDLISNGCNNFESFISVISGLEGHTHNPFLDDSGWCKWKSPQGQVVIQTPQYYYKLYEKQHQADPFYFFIRKQLAQIYTEMGIHWEIQTITGEDGSEVQIEQREKLEVITEASNIPFSQILLQWQITLNKLEDKCGLKQLTKQLKLQIPQLHKIKLIRDCINKYEDYAIKDDQIYLLDDADWFLAMIDEEGNWIELPYNIYTDLITVVGNAALYPLNASHANHNKQITHLDESIKKWCLIPTDNTPICTRKALQDARSTMIEQNIKLLHTGNTQLINENKIQPLTYDNKLGLSFSA